MGRVIITAGLLLFVLPATLVASVLLLAFGGSPGQCGGGRSVVVSSALSQSYEERWLRFNAILTSGRPATITFSDSEATSRTRDFLASSDTPLHDVRLCFVPSGGDANATISPPFGPDIEVRVKGTVDLSGRHPRARVSSIQLGALPSFVTRPVRGLVTRIIDDQSERIELDHRLSATAREGEVTITGEP